MFYVINICLWTFLLHVVVFTSPQLYPPKFKRSVCIRLEAIVRPLTMREKKPRKVGYKTFDIKIRNNSFGRTNDLSYNRKICEKQIC